VGQEVKKSLDLAFEVPSDSVPVLLEFKLNCIVEVPRPVSAEQAPAPAPFVEIKAVAPGEAQGNTPNNTYPPANQGARNDSGRRKGGLSPVGRMVTGGVTDEDE